MSRRHGPNSWDNYEAVHQSYMKRFEHFIVEDGLQAIPTPTLVRWEGELYCLGGIEVHVTKIQRVTGRAGQMMVETTQYSYHVLRRTGTGTTNLLRYDNVHVQPDHPDAHHRHRYDADGNEIEPPMHVGEEGWPTLGDVLPGSLRSDEPVDSFVGMSLSRRGSLPVTRRMT
jgi:hypothetical protein